MATLSVQTWPAFLDHFEDRDQAGNNPLGQPDKFDTAALHGTAGSAVDDIPLSIALYEAKEAGPRELIGRGHKAISMKAHISTGELSEGLIDAITRNEEEVH